MNTNLLKKFAQAARNKLIEQVTAKLNYVLTHDTSEFRGKADTIAKLKEEIKILGQDTVIDKVAYTWFNRVVALRYMDANGYQPTGISIVSPADSTNSVSPQILDEAHAGNIPSELSVNKQLVLDILDGRQNTNNPDNEAYRLLLVAACNQLHTVFPFLFERIDDYTELLLPDDLTSPFNIVTDVVSGMSTEDCSEVEIIGWLYQFYISEKKDEVFASKKAVKKEDIPAATQLFTPRWIVEYMVQNSVGKLWIQNKPKSRLREHMPYYIESPASNTSDYLKLNSIEELRLLDQACGSGHILVYGFELLYHIYEEEGYNPSEIPQLIVEKNLYGLEIDERAAQLAGMALMMKARSYSRRFFRKEIKPNILCFKDLILSTKKIEDTFQQINYKLSDSLNYDLKNMQQATNYGSLIIPHTSTQNLESALSIIITKEKDADIFLKPQLEQLRIAIDQLVPLSQKYHCVVDNPPYMGGGNMNKELGDFVKTNYPDSKADLMACFMEAGLNTLEHKGFLGMINQHSWMFLSSYERLRNKLIESIQFDSLLHLGPRTFPEIGGEVVQNASFTLLNSKQNEKGSFIRLVDLENSELKRNKTLEAIQNPNCGWFYTAYQKNFEKIPGSPIGYWLSKNVVNAFLKKNSNENLIARHGLLTGNDSHYLKYWFEPSTGNIGFNCKEYENIEIDRHPFYPMNKGGSRRKWYGNLDYIVCLSDFKSSFNNNKIKESSLFFKEGLTWSEINTGGIYTRLAKEGVLFGHKGPTAFFKNKQILFYFLGFSNTKPFNEFKAVINSSLSFTSGNMEMIPIIIEEKKLPNINGIVSNCIEKAQTDWDSREGSWDFLKNDLIRLKGQDLEESYDLYQQYWKNKFFQLHSNEEELNRQFIEIYGLQDELTPEVPLEEITILKEETKIIDGELVFLKDKIFQQFMSYAVGCMFGRYSLDKEGLILANQGETVQDYLQKVGESSFLPDEDNIIPVLDDEWFEDDIVARFYEFLKVSFGEKNFQKNLSFVEDCLGKDVRKYFVKDFYKDHIQRYKKRPIYWMFSSPKGYFNVLVYLHRYTPDTMNRILNSYLKEFIEKLKQQRKQQEHIEVTGTPAEQGKALKEIDKIDLMIADCHAYEVDIMYPLAGERIALDLDDGVLVNYNKIGKAVAEVSGLNDKKTKKKVKGFDWIDTTQIR